MNEQPNDDVRVEVPDSAPAQLPSFFGFMSQRECFQVTKDHGVQIIRLGFLGEPPALRGTVRRKSFVLPLATKLSAQGVSGYPTFPGLIVVTGRTKAGKSRFIRALQRKMLVQRLAAVEPYDDPEEIETTPTFASADGALAYALHNILHREQEDVLFCIDSLRAPVFETTGAAGEKGIIMPFFTAVTRVSNQLAKAGVTIMATVNPMNEDEQFEAAFIKKLTASVSHAIEIKSIQRLGKNEVFKGVVTSRPYRDAIPFELSVPLTLEKQVSPPEGTLDLLVFESQPDSSYDIFLNNAIASSIHG